MNVQNRQAGVQNSGCEIRFEFFWFLQIAAHGMNIIYIICLLDKLTIICFVFYSTDPDHLKKYAHPGDWGHQVVGNMSHCHSEKQKCRYGIDCYKYVVAFRHMQIENRESGGHTSFLDIRDDFFSVLQILIHPMMNISLAFLFHELQEKKSSSY
jgi:hypothetical protein